MTASSYIKLIVGTSIVTIFLQGQTNNSAQSAQPTVRQPAQTAGPQPVQTGKAIDGSQTVEATLNYVLGPGDTIIIRAVGIDEFSDKADTKLIDMRGYVDVPIVGHVKAASLTVQELEATITKELQKYVRDPQVTVTVAEFKSQPVSVIGSVNAAGVYKLTGQNTLFQVLSQAQGLTDDAGNTINITREKAQGRLPLPGCAEDSTGQYYTATVDTKRILDAKDPSANIVVKPNDVISVPKAEMVYVVGAVIKSGAFVLNQRESMSVLQAVSMAEGLEKTSAASRAKIIRRGEANSRIEIPADLKKILAGQKPDMPLYANDILFVPSSAAKTASLRMFEAAISVGTGLAIYRR